MNTNDTTDDNGGMNHHSNTQAARHDGGVATDGGTGRTDAPARGRSEGSAQGAASPVDVLRGLRIDQQIALAGGVIAVIGSVLPWASFFGISFGGLSGNGKFTLALALVAGAVAFLEPDAVEKWASAIVAGCGVLIALIGVFFYLDYSSIAAMGLYVTIVGGVVIALPQARHLYRRYQSDADTAR